LKTSFFSQYLLYLLKNTKFKKSGWTKIEISFYR